jgi:hypothetical protein
MPMMRRIAGATVALVFGIALACRPPHTVDRSAAAGLPDASRPAAVVDGSAATPDVEAPGPEAAAPTPDSARADAPAPGERPDTAALDQSAVLEASTPDRAAPDRSAVLETSAPDRSPEVVNAACPPAPAPDEAIADFEGNQPTTVLVAGRGGTTWALVPRATTTGTVLATPIPERCGSRVALRVMGSIPAGQVILAQALFLAADASGVRFYDARAYRGVRFSLRAAAAGPVRVKIADRDTAAPGRVCTVCDNHFSADRAVTTAWNTFTVPWTALAQLGSGDRFSAIDLTSLYAIEFVPTLVDGAFELWIDDVSFVR